MSRILVLGGGFAGLWAAASAARLLDEAGNRGTTVTLVNRDRWHTVRVRNYEPDLRDIRVPLDDVLGPIGVERIEAEINDILPDQNAVACADGRRIGYDRLVIALGSELVRPPVPGLAEQGFDVDTFAAAERLEAHLQDLAARPAEPGRSTVVVIGAGLTGVEVATEMPDRLRRIPGLTDGPAPRVVLVDRNMEVGAWLAADARAVLREALSAQAIELRTGVSVSAVDRGVMLSSGERIDAATVIWCGGLRAAPAIAALPAEHDTLGRLRVDNHLRVTSLPNVFAAGDAAVLRVDDTHDSVMSCQHARPMGRFAGHNAAADLIGRPMLDLSIPTYVTIMDLGAWGALYTQGWDRRLVASGAEAKRTKETINRVRIYPPLTRDRQAILDAAAPFVQAPPAR